MVSIERCRAGLIGTGLIWFALSVAAQGEEKFTARLSVAPVEPSTQAGITGTGTASATLVGTKLSITGTFEGLLSPATVARVHRGLATGVRGSAFFDLDVSRETSGSIMGSVDLTAEQMESLRQGRVYVQIDSENAPDGNLWGWLLR